MIARQNSATAEMQERRKHVFWINTHLHEVSSLLCSCLCNGSSHKVGQDSPWRHHRKHQLQHTKQSAVGHGLAFLCEEVEKSYS
jgi:hypothetical protein